MNLHADFSQRAAVHTDAVDWIDSPMPGVARKMLDRIGDEVARATSVVRYAPGSRFSAHTHGGGEEFLVLEGVFQDEHGDYPEGWYVRNPPHTSHTPGSDAGCIILVKLWQFSPDDTHQMRIPVDAVPPVADQARPHVLVQPLHRDARESVRIETWAANQTILLAPAGGIELFVLDGEFSESGESGERFRAWSWLRLPSDMTLHARTGAAGARLWVKEGHLAQARQDPAQAAAA